MNSKLYPTRMHEVLGVETKELFAIKGSEGQFYLNDNGDFRFVRDLYKWSTDDVNPYSITKAINHGITRRPRLTEEQVKQLNALVTLGFKWLCQESNDYYVVYVNKPVKSEYGWNRGGRYMLLGFGLPSDVITDLVSWSDPEPLDIVATLKAAGVEVEE